MVFHQLRYTLDLKLKRAPLFHPIRKLELANVFRAVDELRELTLHFYWSPVFTMSFVIGKSDNCGFGFMTLNWKPLYVTKITSSAVAINNLKN